MSGVESKSLSEIGISNRVKLALGRGHLKDGGLYGRRPSVKIRTVGDLISRTRAEIADLSGIGEGGMKEIDNALREQGLWYADE